MNKTHASLPDYFEFSMLISLWILKLLELWQEGAVSPDIYSDSEESGSENEEATDDDEYYDDDERDESIQESDVDGDDDFSSETNSQTEEDSNHVYDNKVCALFLLFQCNLKEIVAT